MARAKPTTTALNPKKRVKGGDPQFEFPQDRVELLANATPAELDTDVPFDDCSRDAERTFRLADLFPPRVIADDALLAEPFLGAFLEALDPEMLSKFEEIDCFPSIVDPLRAPNSLLDGLLAHLGNPFTLEDGIDNLTKRAIASALFTIYGLKGTCIGMIGAVRLIYGIEITKCVQTNTECWVLGTSTLNRSTILCGSDAQERRTFSVIVDRNLTDTQVLQITNIIEYMKPANTFFAGIIQPGHPRFVGHWALGFSDLGKNTDLHA